MSKAKAARLTQPRHASPTLGLYLARRYAWMLVFVLAGLTSLIYVIDALEMMRRLGHHGISAAMALKMSLFRLPDLGLTMLPFVVLLATLALLRQLTRSNEITILRAAGLPTWRLLTGPMSVVALAGIIALFVANPLAATLLKRYEAWQSEVMPGSAKGVVTSGGAIWLKQRQEDHDFFITARDVQSSGQSMKNGTVFLFSPEGDFQARLDAQSISLIPGFWKLGNTTLLTPNQAVKHEDSVTIPTDLTPQMIQSSFNPPGTLTIWELGRFINVLREAGFPSSAHEMQYQRLWALPALLLTMFWLAVPWGLRNVRGGGVWSLVAAGVGMGFGFYLLINLFTTFGLAGRLNVVMAAWAPVLIAGLCATALLLAWREE
ncbi:MAG TPA: LPS export ABC transporter permease LptG [Alphaproteobacteria bacterium]|nr:LPS export ABC transporter permease LptG [Alphaproteobacteria bacterium]